MLPFNEMDWFQILKNERYHTNHRLTSEIQALHPVASLLLRETNIEKARVLLITSISLFTQELTFSGR